MRDEIQVKKIGHYVPVTVTKTDERGRVVEVCCPYGCGETHAHDPDGDGEIICPTNQAYRRLIEDAYYQLMRMARR